MNRNPMDESLKRWLREEASGQAHTGGEAANTPDLEHILEVTAEWGVPAGKPVASAWETFTQRIEAEQVHTEPTLVELLSDPDLQPVLAAADAAEVPFKQTPTQAWAGLQSRIAEESVDKVVEQPTKVLSLRSYVRWAGAAAAAVALVMVAYFVTRGPADRNIYASAGETKQVSLPDGSVIELNAASMATFDPGSWEENRTVNLEGEGFFRVKPGSKFTVETAQGQVTVLGTSFNVIARDRQFLVACYTGKVAVKRATDETEHILLPGTFVNNLEAKRPQTFTLVEEKFAT